MTPTCESLDGFDAAPEYIEGELAGEDAPDGEEHADGEAEQ